MHTKDVIRLPGVKEKTQLSRSTIYRLASQGKFPTPIRLAENSVGWYADEIEEFLASRPRASQREAK
jgi:prophage regulatory protein